ncbi:MAG: AAA family ATPase [Prevotella sp.]|nr:AAA family ATPase [Prevotella sp.]
MILNLGSLAFDANIESGGGTPAWGTELGQGEGYKFGFEDMSDFFTGMVYKSVPDLENVSCPLGKGGNQRADYDFSIASIFDKVYVNGKLVEGGRFLLLVVKKLNGDYHVGRRSIKYNPRMTYRGEYINEDCYKKMAFTMGIPENAAWFVYEFFIVNQDELHFTAFELAQEPRSYRNNDERRNAFLSKLPKGNKRPYTVTIPPKYSFQQIFYGAPGTGKSNTIKREVDEKGKTCFRTTFHPDSDYSTFVGTYKPSMKPTGVTLASGEREEVITYKFIPQAFTRSYIEAWKSTDEVYLVIEEINRGNCAQIFGDLFQLLDRKDGVSEYPVEADTDLATYLAEALAGSKRDDIPQEVLNGTKLILPSNLYIWATMNTSDQSLFPIDSAFKRRWEWKYIPIDTKKESWIIAVDGENYSWTSFLDIVNERVFKATSSEDKQLGFYFCKVQNNVVSAETFVSKVLFYLWNDVFKDYDEGDSIFKDTEEKQLPFSKFYNKDGSVNSEMVKELLTALKIEKTANLVEPEKDSNNFDRYSLNGSEPKGKSDLGLSIMELYLSEHSEANYDEIKQVFPDSMLGNIPNRGLIVKESTPLDSYSRNYTPKLFTSADGIKYRIYKQWTVANIGNIIGFAREQGWNVEQAQQWDRKDNQA